GDEILDERKGADGRDGDRLALGEGVHPGHAHEPRLAVDLGAARAALPGLAVPPAREVVGLRRLDPVDDVQHDHALVALDAILLEVAAAGIAAEHPHREGRHYFRSRKISRSSGGISGSGSRARMSCPSCRRSTTLYCPQVSSV